MVDDGGENIFRRTIVKPDSGLVPTGEDSASEGESVRTEEDIASGYVPDTDEILRMAEEHRRGLHPNEELPPEPVSEKAPEEEMEEIE